MKIKWLGHSCFLLTSEKGTRILMDPFTAGQYQNYPVVKETVDIVTISHGHPDHNNVAAASGNPEIVKESGTRNIKGVSIKGINVWHDENKGKERGENIIFCLEVDGVQLCHVGDLGHSLSGEQISEIGSVDVLLIPIDGVFTIDAGTAKKVCDALKPKLVIPMHYKTDSCDWPQWSAKDFVKDVKNVRHVESSEVEITKDKLPAETEYIVLGVPC
ncbi:MAG: MBL fold metallo-hydrolase [Chloroflexi bacterium]|nr:MBL fold metallo-hydrolase [Chloroflexota bacterium]